MFATEDLSYMPCGISHKPYTRPVANFDASNISQYQRPSRGNQSFWKRIVSAFWGGFAVLCAKKSDNSLVSKVCGTIVALHRDKTRYIQNCCVWKRPLSCLSASVLQGHNTQNTFATWALPEILHMMTPPLWSAMYCNLCKQPLKLEYGYNTWTLCHINTISSVHA